MMGSRARNAGVNAAALTAATVLHLAILGYLALYLRPFQLPPPGPPMVVELVEMPPLYVEPPPLRERLDVAEIPPALTAPRPRPAEEPRPAPPPDPTPAPPRPEVLTASIPDLATAIAPEPQAPKPVIPALQTGPRPEFLPDSYQDILPANAPVTASAPAATLAPVLRPTGPLSTAAAAQLLRDAPGGAGATSGIDDRWRVRPDGRPYADCPPILPERMTAAQRARCVPAKPPVRSLNMTADFKLKDSRFEAEARRKELMRDYRANIRTPHPGLNCSLRGVCPKK